MGKYSEVLLKYFVNSDQKHFFEVNQSLSEIKKGSKFGTFFCLFIANFLKSVKICGDIP
jgi:hypothetical protein